MKFSDVIDPKNFCRDVSNVGHWGIGDVEVNVNDVSDIDYAMSIITQALA